MPDSATTGLTVFLAANVGKFKKDMADAGASVGQFGSSVSGTLKGIVGASQAIQAASIAAGLALGTVGAIAAKMAGELETQMNNVATVWDEAGQKAEGTFLSLGDAADELLDVSGRLPQSATTLAAALYNVASSGFQGTEAMKVMTASAMAASAGLTTTDVAARGITTVLNAYGEGASRASYVSDVLFATVNLGVVTFEELSSVMGEFIGMAATAGVKITDANAALATMTLGGISASEAATALNRVFQEFIEPTSALSAVLQQLGYESGAAALKQDGLHVVMMKLKDLVGSDNVEAWASLFDEVRAVKGVLSLVADDGEGYIDVVGKMTNETVLYGQTQKALDKQSQSTGFQMTILKNNITAMAIEYGQVLLPVIRFVTEVLGDFAAGLRALPDWLKLLAAGALTLTGVLVVLAGLWVGNKITSLLFAATMRVVSGALTQAGISTMFLTRALHGLKVAMGIFGVIMAAASIAMVVFGAKQDDVGAGQEELKDTLDQVTGAVTEQTGAFLRARAVTEGWDKDAKELGVSLEVLTKALLGDAAAMDEVNRVADAALAKGTTRKANAETGEITDTYNAAAKAGKNLKGAIGDTAKAHEKAEQAILDEAAANSADADTVKTLTTAKQEERKTTIARAEAHIDAIETIQKEIDKTFDLAEAYKLAVDAGTDTGKGSTQAADNARRDRHKAASDAMDKELELEQRGLDQLHEIRQQALDDQQDAERNAFEEANRTFERALADRRRIEDEAAEVSARARTRELDDRQDLEKDGLAQILRIQKNAYDDQARARRDAHDDEMEELRDQNDARLELEEEAWVARQQEIQHLIDDTFGVERQGYEALLATEEDAYEDRVDIIEEEGDKLVRAEGNAFDDRERILQQAYDDAARIQQDALATRHTNEKQALVDDLAAIKTGTEDRRRLEDQAWDDLVRLDADKMDIRHRQQKTKFDEDLQAEKTHMDDRHTARTDGLAKIQLAEDDAADTSLAKKKEKHVPTMVEIQKQAEDLLKAEQKKNTDLAEIARLGGEKINSVTLAEIAKLPPEVVAVIAASGPTAIQQLGTTLATAAQVANIDPIKQAFNRWGQAAGTGMVEGFKVSWGAPGTISHGLLHVLGPILGGPPGGDGPGRATVSGAALRRVESVLGSYPGARITNTLRTPEHNAALGGSPTSYHLDRNNPAVDITGSTTVLNALYHRLASMGGWRELLWQVAGHYDHIHAAAEGHYAQIAPAGAWRLWAEPETGGEAYIPLASSKRGRSTGILAQVASHFGYGLIPMAAGGITGGSANGGGPTITIPIHVEARVDAGIDMGVAGRVIGDQVERGVRTALGELERRVVVKAWRN